MKFKQNNECVKWPYRDHLTLHHRRHPFRPDHHHRFVIVHAAAADHQLTTNTLVVFCGANDAGDGGGGVNDAGVGLLIELVHRSMQDPP